MYLLAYEPMPKSRPPMNGRTIRSLTRERRRERRSETKRLKAEGAAAEAGRGGGEAVCGGGSCAIDGMGVRQLRVVAMLVQHEQRNGDADVVSHDERGR